MPVFIDVVKIEDSGSHRKSAHSRKNNEDTPSIQHPYLDPFYIEQLKHIQV